MVTFCLCTQLTPICVIIGLDVLDLTAIGSKQGICETWMACDSAEKLVD
jgi:hypothetical protein